MARHVLYVRTYVLKLSNLFGARTMASPRGEMGLLLSYSNHSLAVNSQRLFEMTARVGSPTGASGEDGLVK